MLVIGNMYKDEAISLAKMSEEIIPSNPLLGASPVDLSLQLPEGSVLASISRPHLTQVIAISL